MVPPVNAEAASLERPDESLPRLFMALFMLSWSIGFLALLGAHLYLRLDAVVWPPAGEPLPPRLLPGLSTLVVLGSSVAYHFGLRGIEKERTDRLMRGLIAATGLATLFMLLQLGAAMQAVSEGLTWTRSVYAAFFWMTAGLHLAHVVVGVFAGAWMINATRVGTFSAAQHLHVRLWGYYWHSVGAYWLLIYLFVFLL